MIDRILGFGCIVVYQVSSVFLHNHLRANENNEAVTTIGPMENIYLFKLNVLHIVIIQYLLSQKQSQPLTKKRKKKEIILQELANNSA